MYHMPDIQSMPGIWKMSASENNRPPLSVNNTKIPDDEKMPDKKQKRGNGLPMIQQSILW